MNGKHIVDNIFKRVGANFFLFCTAMNVFKYCYLTVRINIRPHSL